MNEIILKAEDLYFSYDDEKSHSLNGLSLEIRKGQKVAFMGPNGSGKSTFFLCCNGIHKPLKGRLWLGGEPFSYDRKGLLRLRSKVGIVFQDPDNQLFSSSVYQEISFGILNLGVPEADAKREVEAVIDHLEITPFRHKPTHALSGGQKKQVSIADILVMHPEIMILDEPAAALDPKHTSMVNQIVNRLTEEGITVLMATHDADYALSWADEVVLLKEGQVLMHGTPEQVFSNKRALAETNLEQPAVIQLFESLCKKGILNPSLPLPRTLSTLESYIEQTKIQKHYGGIKTMNQKGKKAILAVSFGTSYAQTRELTIDAIEKDLSGAFPDHVLYRAWTSKMILAKLKKRDGIQIDTVCEAMERMIADGITELIVQPTHVINGIENDLMQKDVLSYGEHFQSISFGTPLLTSQKDNEDTIRALMERWKHLKENEVLVLMGHGTTHYANAVYAALDYTFKDMGFDHVFLGTVEAYPTLETLLKQVKEFSPKKVHLAPFMIVAGDHARNDMAGDDPDSWRYQFEHAGFDVECHLIGLGEYEGIRKIFVDHAKESC